jgi:alanyl-tRNA synthetase
MDKTPFYAESGGQEATWDFKKFWSGDKHHRHQARKRLIIHFAERLPETNSEVLAVVDKDKRKKHRHSPQRHPLLHAALRRLLGTHVAQKDRW